ncbi:MAG TPA: hypothetical protein VNU46_00225 [Gemmatimonadaceae bacterium]|nr:hypothetical protein [Gemmatimonadaceae bacterium]
MRDAAPQRSGMRWGAFTGFILVMLFAVIMTVRTWLLTSGAAFGWRVRILLPDTIAYSLIAAGFGLAAFGSSGLRRAGWSLVGLVVLGAIGWTALTVYT